MGKNNFIILILILQSCVFSPDKKIGTCVVVKNKISINETYRIESIGEDTYLGSKYGQNPINNEIIMYQIYIPIYKDFVKNETQEIACPIHSKIEVLSPDR